MNAIERIEFAMKNYMSTHPDEVTPYGRRGHFDVRIAPKPQYFKGGQWSDGDETSRALDAWLFARRITNDYTTGIEIEKEQWRYFQNIINKDTGLIYVMEHSYPNREGYYYHMWDQGRALKHLVNKYVYSYMVEDKIELKKMIDKMINSCVSLSSVKLLQNGKIARYWETDTFVDNLPIDKTADYGTENFVDFTIVCVQLLDPVVKLFKATGESKYLDLSLELANGFIGGYEKRRGSTMPMFTEEGAFAGHFHTCISGLSAIVILAKELYHIGNKEDAKELIDLTVKSYNWIFSDTNINKGSLGGMFPEGTGEGVSENTEFCCTADMIELSGELAEVSEIIPHYEFLDKLWEDCERFTVNELYAMQILNPEAMRKCVLEDEEVFDKMIPLVKGGWAASRVWPHEMIKIRGEERIFYTIGCCIYSGQRGIYSYLNAMVAENEDNITIRFGGTYKSNAVDIQELEGGGISILTTENKKITFRIPSYICKESLKLIEDENEIEYTTNNNRISFIANKGIKYKLIWENIEWSSVETVGIPNDGYILGYEKGKQCEFTFKYKGNKIIDIKPDKNVFRNYFEGL